MPKKPQVGGRKTGREPAYRVFVSHATGDKWIATTICEKIDAVPGVATFRDDRDIGGGDDIPDTLLTELEQSDQLLLLLTPTSITRQWVILEVGMAVALRKRIVPVCYNAMVDQMPILSMTKAYLLNDFDSYLADLRKRVQKGRT
ncbi:MAG TPA: toll/interleukin-1 receptor domain-containing protein [Fimbriiglobus sp.]|nr:toll/interleukin-1 receptor domain-containing protein [Fimbriiglobus sp.]